MIGHHGIARRLNGKGVQGKQNSLRHGDQGGSLKKMSARGGWDGQGEELVKEKLKRRGHAEPKDQRKAAAQ